MKIPVKKEVVSKTHYKKILKTPGPKVRDIKTDKTKSFNCKESINSQIIEIKEEKEEKKLKIYSIKIVFLITAILIFFISFIYLSLFYQPADTLLKFAPKETFFYFYLNSRNFFKNKKIDHLLKKFGGKENLENNLNEILNKNFLNNYNLSFKDDIKPTINNEIAFIGFKEKEGVSFSIILKINSKEQFLKTVEKIKPKNIQELNISEAKIQTFSFDNSVNDFSLALIDKKTIILAKNKEIIEKIVQTYKTKNHLQIKTKNKNFAKIYLNGELLPQNLFSDFFVKIFKKDNSQPFYPLLKTKKGLFEIKEVKNGLLINYSAPLNTKKSKKSLSKFHSKILSFLPNDTLVLFLNQNLKNTYLETKEFFQNLEEDNKNLFNKYFEVFENELKQKYNLDIENDLLSFLEKETIISLLPKENNKENFAIFANIKNVNDVEKKLENIFFNLFVFSNLKEKPLKLSDGSEAIELVPDKKVFKIKKENKKNIFNLTKKSNNQVLISYAIRDNILIIAKNNKILSKIIENNKKLITNPSFSKTYQKINGQEMESLLYFNIPAYLEHSNKTSSQTFWQPIKSFLFGTKTKNNQILGKGFLMIE